MNFDGLNQGFISRKQKREEVAFENLPPLKKSASVDEDINNLGKDLLMDFDLTNSQMDLVSFKIDHEFNYDFVSLAEFQPPIISIDKAKEKGLETFGTDFVDESINHNDPLSDEDKNAIYQELLNPTISEGLKRLYDWANDDEYDNSVKYQSIMVSLSKAWTEGSEDPYIIYDLNTAEKIMGVESYTELRKLVRDPEIIAQKLDIEDKQDKKFAAHSFLRAAVRSYFDGDLQEWSDDTESNYWKKLDGGNENYEIMPKNIAMMNSKYQVLNGNNFSNPVAKICSNAYLVPPQGFQQHWIDQEYGSEKEYLLQSKTAVVDMMKKLSENIDTNHVVKAFAELERREKIQIYFSSGSSTNGIDPQRPEHYKGVYGNHHSIFLSSIMYKNHKIDVETPGVFIHEATHMLLDKTVNQNSSPVKTRSKLEKKLIDAICNDFDHRKFIDLCLLTDDQKRVWECFVNDLEENEGYFKDQDFHPETATDLEWETMFVESIVRVMQMRALDISLRDIEFVAPHLTQFYYDYTKPLLEDYAAGGSPSKFIEKQESQL